MSCLIFQEEDSREGEPPDSHVRKIVVIGWDDADVVVGDDGDGDCDVIVGEPLFCFNHLISATWTYRLQACQ